MVDPAIQPHFFVGAAVSLAGWPRFFDGVVVSLVIDGVVGLAIGGAVLTGIDVTVSFSGLSLW